MKISVIVPIYGVEKFVEKCAASLFEQTMREDVEFIFVNDATKDNSINIIRGELERYPERIHQVRIVEHDVNKGLPAARNSGLSVANGEYIFHCDGDDFVEKDMLQTMYNQAIEESADILWCDYYLTYENSERYLRQPYYPSVEDALKGILCGRMKYNVWNKLIKRSLYTENKISFPSGLSMGEDMTIIKLFVHAKKVVYLPKAFYHYVQYNSCSITQGYTPHHLEALRKNTDNILNYLNSRYDKSWNQDIYSFCLLMKWPFLVSNNYEMYQLWKEWFPESNKYIWSDKKVSKRIRLIEWFASKGMFFMVWLHYWIVIKFLYSIIYR